jgi:hypothetical protein
VTFFTAFHQIFYRLAEVAEHISAGIFKQNEITYIEPAQHPFRIDQIDLNFDGYKEYRNIIRAGAWTDSEDDNRSGGW